MVKIVWTSEPIRNGCLYRVPLALRPGFYEHLFLDTPYTKNTIYEFAQFRFVNIILIMGCMLYIFMRIIAMCDPEDGHLLVDGCYINNVPGYFFE